MNNLLQHNTSNQLPPAPSDIKVAKERGRPEALFRGYPPFVLVVTDNSQQAIKLRHLLEKNGCQVYWSNTTTTGLDAARQHFFDVIVVDIDEPDHISACQKIKSYPELADIATVLLSPCKQPYTCTDSDRPIYQFPKDASLETRLMQVIGQVHYLVYRYLSMAN
jgi:hypothetical protein